MKKSISINLQGLLFHVEEDGYEQLRQYLAEVKAHFSNYAGAAEIVADIESRIAELFAARLGADKQVISAADVAAVTAQLGRVADFDLPEDEDEPAAGAAAGTQSGSYRATADAGQPAEEPAGSRRLVRDEANKKIAGVAAGLAYYFNTNPLWIRLGFVLTALLNTSWLGDLDRHLHINFGGISVLSYLILWAVMPKSTNLPPVGPDTRGPGAGRKLYRDTEYGSLGGVAAGLAHYLKLDVTLIRVVFVVLFFAGAGFLLYLILWIVVPEAKTLSEKLEMRGEDVTLASIDQSLRSEAPPGAGRARVVQENLRSVGSSIAPIFKFLFALVAGFAGFILLVVSLAMIVAFGAVLGVVLGVFPADMGVQTGEIPAELLRATFPTWGLIAGFVAFLIPAISLLLLALRLFIRRQFVPTTVRLGMLGIWLLSLFGIGAAFANFNRHMRERGEVQRTQDFALNTPVVVLDSQYETSNMRVRNLKITAADSGLPARLVARLIARGANNAEAREAAESIVYSATLRDDSVLMLPHEFRIKNGAPWRDQDVRPTLQLPANVRFRLTRDFVYLLDDEIFDTRYVDDELLAKRLFVVEKGQFRLVSGPETTLPKHDDSSNRHDDDEDFDISYDHGRLRINGLSMGGFELAEPGSGAASRTFRDAADFDHVEISGAYQARIRGGKTFRVVARGDADDLDDVSVRVNGSTLEISPKHSMRWFRWRGQHPVVFDIETPTLDGLDLSGATHADVSGFRGSFDIDQSGASWLKLVADGGTVHLGASGACHTLLMGAANQLEADLSGASELRAKELKALNANVEASGASRVSVWASRELKVDASGASHITYFGTPTDVESNSNGAGRIRNGERGQDQRDADNDTEDEDAADADTEADI